MSVLTLSRIERLMESISKTPDREALVWKGRSYTFQDLDQQRRSWLEVINRKGVQPGEVVGLRAGYCPQSVSLLLALLSNRNITALLPDRDSTSLAGEARAESVFTLGPENSCDWKRAPRPEPHPLITSLRQRDAGGFIVFTSGSTGRPKAVLHDAERFLSKFEKAGKRFRTLIFLPFDHIAGLDTLFYTLCYQGTLVLPERRDVSYVCSLVENQAIEVLPVSPTFLNLLCLSKEYRRYDLSSLKIVTYGSEPMSPTLLPKIAQCLPHCRIIQKYGASEFGSPPSRSRRDDSLWIHIDPDHCEVRVTDGILWTKSRSAMMGYLNAPNVMTDDGWLCTNDAVVVDRDWIRILGRQSDLIAVGGEKLYPSEVETVLLELGEVRDASVWAEPNPLMGQIPCASVQVQPGLAASKGLATKIRKYCRQKLAPYKVPVRIELTDRPLTTARGKKIRGYELDGHERQA